jgi:hypothetical protein
MQPEYESKLVHLNKWRKDNGYQPVSVDDWRMWHSHITGPRRRPWWQRLMRYLTR